MITVQTKATYSVIDGLPAFIHLPHGDHNYYKLHEYHALGELEWLINRELEGLGYSLDKYDSVYEPENKKMCEAMWAIKLYLDECLVAIKKLKTYKEVK